MSYTFASLVDAYGSLGLAAGDTVLVAADLTKVMDYETRSGREILSAHYRAIREHIGEGGTIVVSAASTNLCNTDTPFDLDATPSFKRGAFSEFIRRHEGARRSFHPFRSYAALGPAAGYIADRVTRNATGPETPEARLVESDAKAISIGLHPRFTCSTVHHVEHLAGVPYRYMKEFLHPVLRDGEVREEPFYMHVLYRDADIQRDGNTSIFQRIADGVEIRRAEIGDGEIFGYGLREFFDATMNVLTDDIYAWCKAPPTVRPYQQ